MAKKEEKKIDLEEVMVSGQSIIDNPRPIVPVSPNLDIILGGGIPSGSFVILTGKAKSGKTLLALSIAANCQKPEYGGKFCPEGRDVYYYNIEGRIKDRDLVGIHNLNIKKLHVIESKPGNILSAEKFLRYAIHIINDKPGAVHILDSFSAMAPEKEINEDISKDIMCIRAKLEAKFCRKTAGVIPINDSIVIGITHLMANPSPWGGTTQEKTGTSIVYQTDVKLHARSVKPIKVGEKQIGQETIWECVVSATNEPPGGKAANYLRYGYGVDYQQEVLQLAVDTGIIKKDGAWYGYKTKPQDQWKDQKKKEYEYRWQGVENMRNAVVGQTELLEEIHKQVKKMLE